MTAVPILVALASLTVAPPDRLPAGAVARFGTVKLRHASYVAAVAFSPDGRLMASGSNTNYGGTDGTVRLWDVATGAERWRAAHEATTVAFAPDGLLIASVGRDGTARLWDTTTGREVRRMAGPRGWMVVVSFSPDGKQLASVSMNSNAVQLWDVATGKEVRQLVADGRELKAVAFAPDGKTVVAGGGSSARTTLWDAATGKVVRTFGAPMVPGASTLAFSPDGRLLATADGEVRLYEVATGKPLGKIGGRRTDVGANRLAFAPDGKTLALGSANGFFVLWDIEADREAHKFTVHSGWTGGVAFSPDGKHVAWGGYGNAVRLWETATGKELHADGVPLGPLFLVGFGPGGTSVVTGDKDVRVWDIGPGGLKPGGRHGEPIPGAVGMPRAISPDGTMVMVGGWNDRFRLFDVRTGKEINPFPAANGGAINAAFTPDGKSLVTVGKDQRTLTLWDLATGREVRQFVGHGSPVDAVAVSPDGKLLASGSTPRAMIRQPPPGYVEDTGIRLWDIGTGKELRQIPGREGTLAFSPDGKLLAAGSDSGSPAGSLRLLDPSTGVEVRRLAVPRLGPHRVVFSPDGKTLATVGRDKMVRLWDVVSGRERGRFEGHTGEVYVVAFSPDGKQLLSGGADTTALLWDLSTLDRNFPPVGQGDGK